MLFARRTSTILPLCGVVSRGPRALGWLIGVGLGLGGCRSQAPAPPAAQEVVVREQGISAKETPQAPQPRPDAARAQAPAPAKDVAKAPSTTADKVKPVPSDKADKLHKEPAQPKAPAQGTKKVLLLGDSLAATGFGVLLQKSLDAHPNIKCARRAKSATGLARPDYFDWFKQGKRAVQKHKPDLVIVILGGNDGQDLVLGGKGKGRWKRGDEWDKAYALRVQEFVDGMSAPGRKLIWLGLPRTDTKNFEKKLVRIRAAQKDALAQRGSWVEYVDTTPMVVDGQGKVKKKVRRGKRVAPLRQKDGIHFTMHGSHYFADRVYPVIVNALGLDPVEAQ